MMPEARDIMNFKLDNSFDDNLALFRAEADKIDPDCAKLLFENLHLLDVAGEAVPGRAAIGEFHKAILIALDRLQQTAAVGES
jgi:hypothetical protein